MKLSIVTPLYNEEDNIYPFLKEVRSVLENIKITDYQVVFVLDKSSDNSFNVLKKISLEDKKIKVLHLSRRYGHQESIVAGIEHSLKADMIITMDMDLQHPPSLIPKLIEKINEGYDVVFTKRLLNKDQGFIRNLLGNLFYKLNNYLSDTKLERGAADFRIIKGNIANNLIKNFPEKDFFLRGLISWIGFKQTYIEYNSEKRQIGKSKFNNVKKFQLAINGIISLSTRPLYISIIFGIIFAILSIFFLFLIIFDYFYNGNIPRGWTTLTSVILIISSIQFLLIGIIGFYIGSIFKEIKNRPKYLIQDKLNID
jgi:dolichol-phosphate mannosyltransferase